MARGNADPYLAAWRDHTFMPAFCATLLGRCRLEPGLCSGCISSAALRSMAAIGGMSRIWDCSLEAALAEAAEMLLWRGAGLKVGCARSGLQALASTGPSAQAVRLHMLASCSSSWCMMPRCLACMQGVTLQGLRKVMTQTLLLGALRLKRAVSATYGRPHAGALPELQSALCLRLPAAIGAASDGVPDLQALALSVQHALLHRLRPDIRPGALLLRALMRCL